MPAFLSPNGKTRIVVDRIITLGGGRSICELQGQFFSMNGEFLDDMAIAESLPKPFRERAVKFVTMYQAAKKAEEVPDHVVQEVVDEPQPPAHTMSPELQRVLNVQTSEERAQEAGS